MLRCSHLCEQPAWYKELAANQDDEDERENKLVSSLLLPLTGGAGHVERPVTIQKDGVDNA